MNTLKLIEICRPKQWKTIGTKDFIEEGYSVYGANGIIGYYSEYTHEKPTIAITCRGATCGELHITKPFSYINGNAMALDNLDEKVLIRYLYYYLKNRGFVDVISGTAQPQITREGLKKVDVLIPPMETQIKIAEALDKAQELIDKRKEQIKKLDEFVQSVFLDMFGDPVKNPKGWEKGTIRDLVSDVKYGTSKKANDNTGQYPILRMNNITYTGAWDFSSLKYIDFEEKELSKYLVHKGDLLFNRTNSKELVGKTAIYKRNEPMAYAGYLIRVRANGKANSEFISAYLNSKYGKLILNNMCKNIIGMANINAQELQDITIYLPPLELQNKFAQIVEKVEAQKELMEHSLTQMENNFNSIMAQAFRGELFN